MEDIKPVIRETIKIEEYSILEKFCRDANLKIMSSNFKVYIRPDGSYQKISKKDYRSDIIFVYVSKSYDKCKVAKEYESLGNAKEFGKILGYPECCIDMYNSIMATSSKFPLFPIEILKRKSNSEFNHLINPITRGIIPNFLVSHFPCSFSCKKSIKYAKILLKLLKEYDKKYAKETVKLLKCPILYINEDKKFIFSNGKFRSNKIINFDKIYMTQRFLEKYKWNFLSHTNKIKVDNSKIIFYNGNSILYTINKNNKFDGYIFQFK